MTARNRHVVAFLLGAVAAFALAGLFSIRFDMPTSIVNDRVFLLLQSRIFLEWPALFATPNLGFPGRIDLLNFPFGDITQRMILFAASMISRNVIVSSNLYVVGILLANFGCAYVALTVYVRDAPRAALGALMFAFIPFFVFRATAHDYLAGFYPAPLAFLMLHRLAESDPGLSLGMALRRLLLKAGSLLCLGVIAASGVYYSFFSVMLIGFGGLVLALQGRDWRPLWLGVAAALVIVAGLVLVLSPSLLIGLEHGVRFPPRDFHEQAYYGIRISDVMGLLGTVGPLPASVQRYEIFRGPQEGFDFWPGPLLSVFALLVCVLGTGAVSRWWPPAAVTQGRVGLRRRLGPVLAGYLVLCLLFAVPYGLGMVFNTLISPEIRAQNRISPFFSFGAVILLLWWWRAPVFWLRRRLGRWLGGAAAWVALLGFVLVNGAASFGAFHRQQADLLNGERFGPEMASAAGVLAAANVSGASRVFQLPVVDWPEAPAIRSFDPYYHFLPYVFSSHRSRVAWSYGLTRDDPAFGKQKLIELMSDRADVPGRLACLGFDAVMIDLRAYPPAEWAAWEAALLAGGARLVHADGLRRFYRLDAAPASGCAAPLVPRDAWLPTTAEGLGSALLESGWYRSEDWGTWGRGTRQTVRVPMDGWGPEGLRLEARSLVLPDATGRSHELTIRAGGKEIGRWQFAPGPNGAERGVVVPRALLPEAGFGSIELQLDAAQVAGTFSHNTDDRLVGLGLTGLRISRAGMP